MCKHFPVLLLICLITGLKLLVCAVWYILVFHYCPVHLLSLLRCQMQFLFSCLVNMYFKAGHTVDAVGFFYGGDCSPTPSVSTWWVPYIQRWKPVISLGQCSHSWYSPTCSKHERRPKALPTRRTPCALRTSIWINFYGGICSHSMSGRARKDLVETRALGTNKQLKTPSQFKFEGKDTIVKQIWCF